MGASCSACCKAYPEHWKNSHVETPYDLLLNRTPVVETKSIQRTDCARVTFDGVFVADDLFVKIIVEPDLLIGREKSARPHSGVVSIGLVAHDSMFYDSLDSN
jgi:hypothetical protein